MDEVLFLKENILKSRQNDNSGKNALKLLKVDKQNEFLFEKNLPTFIELIDFLKGQDDVFVITGFTLCGKSLLTSVIPQLITEKTIFQFFKCTSASTLDDLLLNFFETFKIYAQKKLVHIPKIETQNFQERINIYLTKCENPIIIVLDGLNEITDSKNKDEIMSFLSQVAGYQNIKLTVTTRNFEVSDFKNINLRLSTSLIKALSQEDFKEYCLRNVINSDGIEDFYKICRGHYFNLLLAMNYIQPTNLTIKELISEVQNSKKSIDDLVISKNLGLVPQNYEKLLWILASSEFGMPIKNLVSAEESDEEKITLLSKKGIIEVVNGCAYVRDFFKKEILKSIEPLAKINIIKGIIKFLEEQLPLKPSSRELKLSRLTIRNEIERLNNILKKSQEKRADKTKASYMTILGYSRQFKTNWDGFDEIIMPKNYKTEKAEPKKEEIQPKIEEETSEEEVFEPQKEDNSALQFAKMLKRKYNYSEAIEQYNQALSEAMAEHNSTNVLDILKDIAECYFKLGDYQNSIENYGKAHEVARNEDLVDECYYILLKIAEIYKNTFKKDLASEIYQDIITQEGVNEDLKLRAELNLFELNFSNLKPNEIIKKYLELLDKAENNKPIAAKIHFRLGFLYDKASSNENAIKHYEASIEACENYDLNENISSCYYNVAEIYSDNRDFDSALKNYLKSFAVDEMTNNFEGMLITAKKIARIYERKKEKVAKRYYEKALDIAKNLNDNYPVACAIIDLGDYYYRQKDDMQALKVYISAMKVLSNQLTHENEMAIKDRINDLRVRMGKDTVDKVLREFL